MPKGLNEKTLESAGQVSWYSYAGRACDLTARTCRDAGIEHFTLLSAIGANPKSSIRYLRLKGELERDIIALAFPRTSIYRPSMLITPKNRYGMLQGFLLLAMPVLDPLLLGPLRCYRSIKVTDLGASMAKNSEISGQGVEIMEWDQFFQ